MEKNEAPTKYTYVRKQKYTNTHIQPRTQTYTGTQEHAHAPMRIHITTAATFCDIINSVKLYGTKKRCPQKILFVQNILHLFLYVIHLILPMLLPFTLSLLKEKEEE